MFLTSDSSFLDVFLLADVIWREELWSSILYHVPKIILILFCIVADTWGKTKTFWL